MKDHKVEFHWVHGFIEKFTCPPNKLAAKQWFEYSKNLSTVVRTLITDSNGEVLYDVEKENPFNKAQKEDDGSEGIEKKKTVRKTTRTRSKK